MVGRVLSELGDSLEQSIPWQRVVNAQGGISPRGDPAATYRQVLLLRDEGVVMQQRGGNTLQASFEGQLEGTINMTQYGWFPHYS